MTVFPLARLATDLQLAGVSSNHWPWQRMCFASHDGVDGPNLGVFFFGGGTLKMAVGFPKATKS